MCLVRLAVGLQGKPSLAAVVGQLCHVDVHKPQSVLPVPHLELYHSNPTRHITGVSEYICMYVCM